MTTFVLDRSRWYRGKSAARSYLRSPYDGLMCCLGLYLESCGVPAVDLTSERYPHAALPIPPEAKWLLAPEPRAEDQHSDRTLLAVDNDSEFLTEDVRERKIQAVFAKHGIEVLFVDSTPTGSVASSTSKSEGSEGSER